MKLSHPGRCGNRSPAAAIDDGEFLLYQIVVIACLTSPFPNESPLFDLRRVAVLSCAVILNGVKDLRISSLLVSAPLLVLKAGRLTPNFTSTLRRGSCAPQDQKPPLLLLPIIITIVPKREVSRQVQRHQPHLAPAAIRVDRCAVQSNRHADQL